MQLLYIIVLFLVNFFDGISTIPVISSYVTDHMNRSNNTNSKEHNHDMFHDPTSARQPKYINQYDAVSHVREVERNQESFKNIKRQNSMVDANSNIWNQGEKGRKYLVRLIDLYLPQIEYAV